MDKYYAVQETTIPYTLEHFNTGKFPVPDTAMIPDENWMRFLPKLQILAEAEGQKLKLPVDTVRRFSIRYGDEIWVDRGRVVAVNGLGEDDSRKRPYIDGIDAVELDYPRKSLPVYKYGDFNLNAFAMKAEPGDGQRLLCSAPAECGKTRIFRSFAEGVMRLSKEDPNIDASFCQTAERGEDGTRLRRIMEQVGCDPERVHVYSAPVGDPTFAHYYLPEYVIYRAHRQAELGKTAIVGIDSLSGLFTSISYAPQIPKDLPGMLGQGLATASLPMIQQEILARAGVVTSGKGSLTLFATLINSDDIEGTLNKTIGPRVSTNNWPLGYWPNLEYPWMDVNKTRAREMEGYCTPERLHFMAVANRLARAPIIEKKDRRDDRNRRQDGRDGQQVEVTKRPPKSEEVHPRWMEMTEKIRRYPEDPQAQIEVLRGLAKEWEVQEEVDFSRPVFRNNGG